MFGMLGVYWDKLQAKEKEIRLTSSSKIAKAVNILHTVVVIYFFVFIMHKSYAYYSFNKSFLQNRTKLPFAIQHLVKI